jgi:shikimate dehydrogenase
MTDRYAVVGNPVAHSLSPEIHAAFARQTGADIEYARLLAPPDGFAACIRAFRAAGGRGANVTLPFKLEAWRLASRRSERAEQAQAVNTLRFDGEEIFGDNTDGAGLTRDVETNCGFGIAGKRVLLLGAGGAARGVLLPLIERKPVALVIANRTVDKAQALAAHFGRRGRCAARRYDELAGDDFDLVINATSASVAGELPPLPAGVFAPGALAYDMMYGAKAAPFLACALAQGAARAVDGLGMLVEQAAESFFVWRAVRPQTAPVIAALRARQ